MEHPELSRYMTWDIERDREVDAAALRALVEEAVARHADYRRDEDEVAAAACAAVSTTGTGSQGAR